MTRLYKHEILRLLDQDPPLIKDARRTSAGAYDVELDSYDLSAGTAVWKDGANSETPNSVKTLSFNPMLSTSQPQFVTVAPGQMIFVVTHEELSLPNNVTATVYSRNKLALDGILALNAGHVDPGYIGPIAIRLINLRKTEWILELGDGIFTIVFDRMEILNQDDGLDGHPEYPKSEMLKRVHQTVADSLSNALLDIFQEELRSTIRTQFADESGRLRQQMENEFVRNSTILGTFFRRFFTSAFGILFTLLAIAGSLVGIVVAIGEL